MNNPFLTNNYLIIIKWCNSLKKIKICLKTVRIWWFSRHKKRWSRLESKLDIIKQYSKLQEE